MTWKDGDVDVDVDEVRFHSMKLDLAVASHDDLVSGAYHVNLSPISRYP